MLKSIKDDKNQAYLCIHWKEFPPVTAVLESRDPNFSVHGNKDIPISNQQKHSVWKSVCGLLKMEIQKCLTCPHIRKIETHPHHGTALVTLDGQLRTPFVDGTTLLTLGQRVGKRC